MTTLQIILVCVLLTIWLCFSVLTLITAIDNAAMPNMFLSAVRFGQQGNAFTFAI